MIQKRCDCGGNTGWREYVQRHESWSMNWEGERIDLCSTGAFTETKYGWCLDCNKKFELVKEDEN